MNLLMKGKKTAVGKLLFMLTMLVLLAGISCQTQAAGKVKVSADCKKLAVGETVTFHIKNSGISEQYSIALSKKGILDYSWSNINYSYWSFSVENESRIRFTAKNPGTVRVTVSRIDGKKLKKIKAITVKVTKAASENDIDEDYFGPRYEKIALAEGSKCRIDQIIYGLYEYVPGMVTVDSGNSKVLSADGDVLTANRVGSAKITVSAEKKSFAMTVTVIPDPEDQYSKLSKKLEKYMSAPITAKNCAAANNAVCEYNELFDSDYDEDEDEDEDEDDGERVQEGFEKTEEGSYRLQVPFSGDIRQLQESLKDYLVSGTGVVEPGISPLSLRIRQVTQATAKKVKISLKKKLTASDIMLLNATLLYYEGNLNRYENYNKKTMASVSIPLIDKKTKKSIWLTGTVKAGQKNIVLEAEDTIPKKSAWYIAGITKKGNAVQMIPYSVIRKK